LKNDASPIEVLTLPLISTEKIPSWLSGNSGIVYARVGQFCGGIGGSARPISGV